MRYPILIARCETNYSAHCPDVPGCIATGATLEQVKQRMKEALEFHFEGMRLDGEAVPPPESIVEYVDVDIL